MEIAILILILALAFSLKSENLIPLIVLVSIIIPLEVKIPIAGLNFNAIRILTASLLVRSLFTGTNSHLQTSTKTLIALYTASLFTASFFHNGPASGPVYISGILLQSIGVFLTCSIYVKSETEIIKAGKYLLIAIIAIAPFMLIERVIGHNFIKEFFNAPSTVGARNDEFRASGPFLHPILAGIAAVSAIPSAWATRDKSKSFFYISSIAIAICVYSSNSSTPFIAAALCLPLIALHTRTHLIKKLFTGFVLTYLLIEVIFPKPAYFQIARIDITGGSTSYFRAELLYQFTQHFNEWFLYGTDYTRHWMVTGLPTATNHVDLTNHYILLGVQGGIIPLTLLCYLIYRALLRSPAACSVKHSSSNGKMPDKTHWAAICTVATTSFAGFSATFFDQTITILFMAIAASFTPSSLTNKLNTAGENGKDKR